MPKVLTNIWWISVACALTAWYIWACAANCAAVSADTSSAAAGTTPVVGAAAAAFWALMVEPIPCRVPAAAAKASGCVVTNDIVFPPLVNPQLSGKRLDDGVPRSCFRGLLFASVHGTLRRIHFR